MFLKSPCSTQPTKPKSSFPSFQRELQCSRPGSEPRVYTGAYCFREGSRIGLCCVGDASLQSCLFVEFSQDAESRTRSRPGLFLCTVRLAHQLTHSAQRALPAPRPLSLLLLVLDGVPGEKNKDEADKFEASRQTKIDETKRCHVVLPARSLHPAFLLPEHTGGVDDCAKVNGSRNVR